MLSTRLHSFRTYFGLFNKLSIISLLSLLLASCGGGAGTVGTATGTALYTSASSSITIPISSVSYSIGGGTAIYKSTSSNPSVATTSVSGNTLNIVGLISGTTQITITDAVGATTSISVTVGNGNSAPALYVTAPSAINLAANVSSTYTIAGGRPQYIISSSNTAVATVGMNGSTFVVTGVSAGTAQIVIFDSIGDSVNVSVTVGAGGTSTTLYTTASSSLTLAVSEVSKFNVGGGTGPYIATSSNASIVTTTMAGSTLTINGVGAGTAQVLIFDSVGNSVTITAAVGDSGATVALFTVAPSTINLKINGSPISYAIGGGKAPYKAATSNDNVVTASISNSQLIVIGVNAGTEQVLVFDSLGASVTITVSVGAGTSNTALYIAAPSTLTLPANSSNHTYPIGGGSPSYSVSSSNTSVATVSIANNALTINTINSGSAQIIVFDAKGDSASIAVTVGSSTSPTPLYVTSASSVTLDIGDNDSFTIGGGNGSYSVSSSSKSVATASISGSQLTVSAVAEGTSQILVFDSTGSSVTIGVTVTKTNTLQISIQPESAIGNVGDTLTFLVSGGKPSYSVTINNPSIASVTPTSVSASGGSFSATLLNTGTTDITITDSSGQTKSLTITASQISTQLRLSPNAITMGEDNTSTLSLNIYGGTAPYTAFTSDQTLTSVSTSGSVLSIGLGTKANRCIDPIDSSGVRVPFGTFDITITVVDSLGASATSILTIKDNGIGSGGAVQGSPFAAPCL
jgi:hypothetical protein